MIGGKGRARQPNYGQIRADRELRKLRKRAAKLKRAINRKTFNTRKIKQRQELKIKRTRIRALAGSKKKPGVNAVRPVLNVLLERLPAKKRLTVQWANIARALLRNKLMELNENSDLRQVMFTALNRISPRVAEFFRTNQPIYLPKGENATLQERLKNATTKQRDLISVSVQRGENIEKVRVVRRPGKPVKYRRRADGRVVIVKKPEEDKF